MFVIAVVSQKGGSGKTTLSGHLSVQAHLSGDGPVAIIDTDPQGSLAAWWNEREDESPIFIQTSISDLRRHLDAMRQAGIKLVVVDTPPAISTQIHEVISVADYTVVPTKPSPHDLRAVGATVKLVQSYKKPMVFVLNDASPRAKITYEAAVALSQHGTVAPVTIHHRTIFASSMIDGRTAMEVQPSGQSGREIAGLWEYLNARLSSEILPTSIGMDALNRRDGSGKIQEAMKLEQYLSEDGREEDPYEMETAAAEDEDQEDMVTTSEADDTDTDAPPLRTHPIPHTPLRPDIGVGGSALNRTDDPWAGPANDKAAAPEPQPHTLAVTYGTPTHGASVGTTHDFARPARAFGRRQRF